MVRVVSASKAQKIKGWDKLVEAYEKMSLLMDVYKQNVRVGV